MQKKKFTVTTNHFKIAISINPFDCIKSITVEPFLGYWITDMNNYLFNSYKVFFLLLNFVEIEVGFSNLKNIKNICLEWCLTWIGKLI